MTQPPTIDDYRAKAASKGRLQGGRRLTGKDAGNAPAGGALLVSIVTPVRNGAAHLEACLASVAAQTHRPIEHIVIDGGSTDGTIEIIRRHEGEIALWTSERDDGISDAFNKGIALSRGIYVGIVNADDWMSPDQVELGVKALDENGADFSFGDLLFYDAQGAAAFRTTGDEEYARSITRRMPSLNHPTVLARRDAYERFGLFDTRYRIAMDYDWLLRVHRGGGRGIYRSGIVGRMHLEGVSQTAALSALTEVREISIAHGLSVPRAYALFATRAVKATARAGLATILPRAWITYIRSMINKDLHTVR